MVSRAFFLALVTGAALYAAPAWACPVLIKANPRVGSTIDQPVNFISLHFSGPVDAGKSTLDVVDASGHSVATGKPQGAGKPVDTIFVPVKLAHGKYKVVWHIHCDCEDGQDSVFPGDYSFTVK